ncbi:hypothetical protein GRI34_00455 [Erythrobacter aquimaris]|uniref:Oligosaccharide flippase family protein n=1 Tax=Qipengyuania aquimaris TaxID=255984 RepID=A0A6I4TGM8_9SPHN|nr:hypothetical protein [Qipengyuania aquimaris]MXO94886.1 hypothetical protein [Qipengyuania aquimaris]
MSARQRILRGAAANFGSLATRIAAQFLTLPILFSSWDAERVGAWLLLFALPAYFGFVSAGFSGAGGTAAVVAHGKGDAAQSRAHFRSSWIIASAATLVLAALFPLAVAQAGEAVAALRSMPQDILNQTLIALTIYIVATSQVAALEIPFRAVGRYADHIALNSVSILAEIVVIAVCVTLSDNIATLAAALAATRITAAIWIASLARRTAPTMFHGPSSRLGDSTRTLMLPSLALMLLPLVHGINLQGYVMVIGLSSGAVILAGFVATRTLTRLLDLFTSFSFSMQFYESTHLDPEDLETRRRLLAVMTILAACIAVVFSAALLVFGDLAQRIFTRAQAPFDPGVASVLLLAAGLRALASAPFAMIAAANRQSTTVTWYFIASLAGLILAASLAERGFALPLVLAPIVLAELFQLVPAFRGALRMSNLGVGEFIASLFSRDRIGDVAWAMRELRRNR